MKTLIVTLGLSLSSFLLSSLLLSRQANASINSSQGIPTATPACQIYSTATSWAQGYGNQYENCNRARDNAESGALHTCYASGQNLCDIKHSSVKYASYDRCEVEALAEARPNSMCAPERTFVRQAWAQNYGNEYANCSQAQRIANDIATQDCYRAGYRRCNVLSVHIIRSNGPQFCEASSVVKARH